MPLKANLSDDYMILQLHFGILCSVTLTYNCKYLNCQIVLAVFTQSISQTNK